jgi:hypothetical protein
MRDLLGEDDALAHILYRCLYLFLTVKAALFSHLKSRGAVSIRHQVVKSEGHEENEGSVNEFDAHSCKTKAE